jgi:hypothetical protein
MLMVSLSGVGHLKTIQFMKLDKGWKKYRPPVTANLSLTIGFILAGTPFYTSSYQF